MQEVSILSIIVFMQKIHGSFFFKPLTAAAHKLFLGYLDCTKQNKTKKLIRFYGYCGVYTMNVFLKSD